jgi:hypothetical protein
MRRSSNPLNAALGDFLGGYPWSHFLTLTFKPLPRPGSDDGRLTWGKHTRRDTPAGVSDAYAMRAWRGYLGAVQKLADVPLSWFYGIEYGEKRGRLHVHALTGNTERLPVQLLREQWRNGFTRILTYDPARGAAHYVGKYVTKQLAEWDISGDVEGVDRVQRYRAPTRADAARLTAREQTRQRAREQSQVHAFSTGNHLQTELVPT